MYLLVLNTKFETIAVVDNFRSLIWVDRYRECGDFEIVVPASREFIDIFKDDYYVVNLESNHTMIVEGRLTKSDSEAGNSIIVTGRSLESILERRIIWNPTVLKGNFQTAIKKIIDENIISPTDRNRKISNFRFIESTDPIVTALTIDTTLLGEDIYSVLVDYCTVNGIGFKVTLSKDNFFEFSLYAGTDRTYEQSENPYVIFSPGFENIINSSYKENKENYKNTTLVGGEERDSGQVFRTVNLKSAAASGIERREIYTDARSVSKSTPDGDLTEDDYLAQLDYKGLETLYDNPYNKQFEGQVDATSAFIFNRDFFMGDTVQTENEYGVQSVSRVIEFIRSQDEDGEEMYPSFEVIE